MNWRPSNVGTACSASRSVYHTPSDSGSDSAALVSPPPVEGTQERMSKSGAGHQNNNRAVGPLNSKVLGGDIVRYIPGTLGPAMGLLVFAAVFTRIFDTGEYGQYSLVFSIATLLAAVAGQWLVQSINRFVGASGDLAGSTRVIGAGLSAIVLTVLAVSVAAGRILWGWVSPEWRPFLVPGALMVLAWSLFQPLLATYQATLRAASNSSIRIAQIGLRLALALGIVLLVWRHPAGLVIAAAAASGLLAAFMWVRLGAPVTAGIRSRALRDELKRWARYGFPMIPWFACTILLSVGDRYLIQWLRDSAELGIYAANYGIVAGGAGLIAAPIRLAAHPFLMRAWGEGNSEAAGEWLSRIITVLVFAMLVVVGPTVLFAEDVARIVLGAEFREGYPVMPIALGGIALWQLGLYLHKPFEFHERTGTMLGLASVAAAVSLVLNILLIPRFGYIAAAWNTVAAYVVYAALTGVLGRRLLHWRIEWRRLLLPTTGFVGALMLLQWVRLLVFRSLPYTLELAASLGTLVLILVPAGMAMMRMLERSRARRNSPSSRRA